MQWDFCYLKIDDQTANNMKLLLLLLVPCLVTASQEDSILSSLRKSMMEGYDKMVRPDHRVELSYGHTFLDLQSCKHHGVSYLMG